MFDITIIEDDYALNNGVSLALKSCGYHTEQLYKLSDFKKDRKTNLIILDINLPDGNGFAFLKDLRITSNVPVVILTANDLVGTWCRRLYHKTIQSDGTSCKN